MWWTQHLKFELEMEIHQKIKKQEEKNFEMESII